MSLLWLRPPSAEAAFSPEERRVRDYVSGRGGVSESAASLASKLDLRISRCRRILEQLAQEGLVRRIEFDDIQPMYARFPNH